MSGAPSPSSDDPGRAGRGLLTHPVGAGHHCLNRASDVRTVQHLLNAAIPGGPRLAEDGRCDALLIERIKAFQVKALHFQVGDGRVDPGGRTLAALAAAAARAARPSPPPAPWYAGAVQAFDSAVKTAEDDWRRLEVYLLRGRAHPPPPPTLTPHPSPSGSRTPGVTAGQLRQIMPLAGSKADDYADVLNAAMAAHDINAPEQRAALLAQISNETGDLHRLVENLNYSAARLMAVWPRRFPTLASAHPYAHNPQALGNKVYANRLDNGDAASNDGYTFRGRGFLQVTGRVNYRDRGFEAKPDALADPKTAADSAGGFWKSRGLNAKTRKILDRSEFNAVTNVVNGGQTGSQERWDAYQRALKALNCRGGAN